MCEAYSDRYKFTFEVRDADGTIRITDIVVSGSSVESAQQNARNQILRNEDVESVKLVWAVE